MRIWDWERDELIWWCWGGWGGKMRNDDMIYMMMYEHMGLKGRARFMKKKMLFINCVQLQVIMWFKIMRPIEAVLPPAALAWWQIDSPPELLLFLLLFSWIFQYKANILVVVHCTSTTPSKSPSNFDQWSIKMIKKNIANIINSICEGAKIKRFLINIKRLQVPQEYFRGNPRQHAVGLDIWA